MCGHEDQPQKLKERLREVLRLCVLQPLLASWGVTLLGKVAKEDKSRVLCSGILLPLYLLCALILLLQRLPTTGRTDTSTTRY